MRALREVDVVGDLAPDAQWMQVSPDAAKLLLDKNAVNRNLREAKVLQYARDMLAGRWLTSNDAICVSSAGELLNGQHRLTAVIRTGVTVRMLVMFGVPREAMEVMDTGAGRSVTDTFKLRGEDNAMTLAAVVRLAVRVSTGRVLQATAQQGIGNSEMVAFVGEHPEIRASAAVTARNRRSIEAPQAAVGVAHWLILRKVGPEAADAFVRRLATRTEEPPGSPILAADSRLRELRRSRAQYDTRNYLYMLIKTWNHCARGQSVRQVSMMPREDFYIPEVVVPVNRRHE